MRVRPRLRELHLAAVPCSVCVSSVRAKGTSDDLTVRVAERGNKNPAWAGLSEEERMMGFEPTTFCMASRRSSQLSYIRAVAKYSPR